MVESLSVELNASRFRGSAFETERVRRPDILGLTREAIFLGLTVFVYRFSPVDVDSKKRFSQFS